MVEKEAKSHLERPEKATPRRATLKDVAKLAGVSPMTVSNVVNGTRRGYNEETRDRVLRAVESVNYRPDSAARSLRTQRHMSVGMLVVQAGQRFLADPYITNLLDGLCSHLNQAGYSMVLEGLPPERISGSSLIRQQQTDGLCILMSGDFSSSSEMKALVSQARQPIILFQQTTMPAVGDICILRQDDFEGGRMLGEHVLERRARRLVALIPAMDWPAMRARADGIAAAVKGYPDASLAVVTASDESAMATQTALDTYLRDGGICDAVLAGNDQMAIAAYRLLQRRSLAIPHDVLLTGFNGFDFLDYFTPRLTSVRSSAHELGELGARTIVQRIEEGVFKNKVMVLPVTFINGATT